MGKIDFTVHQGKDGRKCEASFPGAPVPFPDSFFEEETNEDWVRVWSGGWEYSFSTLPPPPLDGMLVNCRVTPSMEFASSHTPVEGHYERNSFLPKDTA